MSLFNVLENFACIHFFTKSKLESWFFALSFSVIFLLNSTNELHVFQSTVEPIFNVTELHLLFFYFYSNMQYILCSSIEIAKRENDYLLLVLHSNDCFWFRIKGNQYNFHLKTKVFDSKQPSGIILTYVYGCRCFWVNSKAPDQN